MVAVPHLTRYESQGLTLLGDPSRPGGVSLAFAERTGGCSVGAYASLNVGDAVGDDADAVAANRRLLLAALCAGFLEQRLVCPKQVHGSTVLVLEEGTDASVQGFRQTVREGCDAVVCLVPDVPVLLVTADCLPLILVAQGGFAVVHAGWRGAEQGIAGKALDLLCTHTGTAPDMVCCYLGPHIGPEDFEVSAELASRFAQRFGAQVAPDARHLDLGQAVQADLVAHGASAGRMCAEPSSTASHPQRFFSYRASGGDCGRLAAVAVMQSQDGGELA